ncbi:MAG: YhbY family RNA-binding protein, partial [Pseudomonadota bacterium]
MKELDQTKKKRLRAAAHHLKPVVMLGNRGYTDSVGAAIDEALGAHELIKVRLRGIEADDRDATVTQICNTYKA